MNKLFEDARTIRVRITLQEPALGTSSGNPELHREFIASKSPDASTIEDEVAAIGADGVFEKSMTVFPKLEDGTPFYYDYQIKGFFKDCCSALKKIPGSKCSLIRAYKKEIDGLLFVSPRKIPIALSGGITVCERPLRASTAQGDRVALASSEEIPAGSVIEVEILCLTKPIYDMAMECLDYGILRGLGQWRNSGKGRFTYEILEKSGGPSKVEVPPKPRKRKHSTDKHRHSSALHSTGGELNGIASASQGRTPHRNGIAKLCAGKASNGCSSKGNCVDGQGQ